MEIAYKVVAHVSQGFTVRVQNPQTGKPTNVRIWKKGAPGYIHPSKRTRAKAEAAAPAAVQEWAGKHGIGRPATGKKAAGGMTVTEFIKAAQADPGVRGTLADESRIRRDEALNHFEAYLAHVGIPGFTNIAEVTIAVMEEWVAAKRKGGIPTGKGNLSKPASTAGLKRDLVVLKRAWNYLIKTQRLPAGTTNPATVIKLGEYQSAQEKAIDRESRTMTDDTFDALLAACDEDFAPQCMRALLMLGGGTGIRPGEARSARWSDLLEVEGGWMLRVRGKAGGREVVLLDETVKELNAWKDRLKEWGTVSPWIICNPMGEPYTKTAWAQMWRKFVRRAGLHGIKYYGLRHRAARKIVVNSGDLTLVQAQLGHANISTSELYTSTTVRTASDRIRKAMGA